jgi:hypothetical protein
MDAAWTWQASPPPVRLRAVAAGEMHSCGILADNTADQGEAVHGWGVEDGVLPVRDQSRRGGRIVCWGDNRRLQASPSNRSTRVPNLGPRTSDPEPRARTPNPEPIRHLASHTLTASFLWAPRQAATLASPHVTPQLRLCRGRLLAAFACAVAAGADLLRPLQACSTPTPHTPHPTPHTPHHTRCNAP